MDIYQTDPSFEGFARRLPEYGLLAGILEMAFRDLGDWVDHLHRRDAINWFRGHHEEKEFPLFTFKEVASSLKLSASQVSFILTKVEEAEGFEREWIKNKQQEERLSCGVRIGPFFEESWSYDSQTHTAVLR